PHWPTAPRAPAASAPCRKRRHGSAGRWRSSGKAPGSAREATSIGAEPPAASGQARPSLQLTEVHAATLLRPGTIGLPAASLLSAAQAAPFFAIGMCWLPPPTR